MSICDVSQPLGKGEDVVERIIDTAPVSVAKDADDRSNGIDFPPAAGMFLLLFELLVHPLADRRPELETGHCL